MAAVIEVKDPDGRFAPDISGWSGALAASCYQCQKCTSGCPVAPRADLKPHQLIRLLQLDLREMVLSSRFIWECTSCQTCATRCPQKVDLASINDILRAMSRTSGKVTRVTSVPLFNEIFLKTIRTRGRIFELGLMAEFKLRTMRLFEDVGKLPMMLSKRKLRFVGPRVGGRNQRKALFDREGNPQ
jgi:heterodisulfide reductase subunit C2